MKRGEDGGKPKAAKKEKKEIRQMTNNYMWTVH